MYKKQISALFAVLVFASVSHAGILDGFLSRDAIKDRFEDAASIANTDGNGQTADDSVYGVIDLGVIDNNMPSASNKSVAIVFATRVISTDGNGITSLGASTAAQVELSELVAADVMDDIGGSGGADVVAVILSNNADRNIINPVTPNGSLQDTGGGTSALSVAFSEFNNATNGWVMEAYVSLTASNGDFFDADIDLGAITTGEVRASLTITANSLGIPTWLPVASRDFDDNLVTGDLSILPQSDFTSDRTGSGFDGGHYFFTSTDIRGDVNPPVPEPASAFVWGGLIGAIGFAGYRRRKKAKAA